MFHPLFFLISTDCSKTWNIRSEKTSALQMKFTSRFPGKEGQDETQSCFPMAHHCILTDFLFSYIHLFTFVVWQDMIRMQATFTEFQNTQKGWVLDAAEYPLLGIPHSIPGQSVWDSGQPLISGHSAWDSGQPLIPGQSPRDWVQPSLLVKFLAHAPGRLLIIA